MRVALFSIYLFLFLLKGSGEVFAGMPDVNNSQTQHHEIKTTHTHQNSIAFKDVDLAKEKTYLIAVGDEEEDTDDSFTRKFKLPARQNATLSYQSILNYLYSCIEASPGFGGLVTDKYILQRVLRV